MKRALVKCGTFFGFVLFLCLLIATPTLFSQDIKDEIQLQQFLDEESSKLDLNSDTISARFGETSWSSFAYTIRLDSQTYEIVLDKNGRNRAVLRHELYHVYDGHLESDSSKSYNWFNSLFIQEFESMVYQYSGIRL